jgi:hypothetical protein
MMTMISTFLSFLAGGLPKILQIFQDRQDESMSLRWWPRRRSANSRLLKRALSRRPESRDQARAIQTQTAGEERQALYAHDIEIGKGASQWMINLRSSVRPVVTYIFVLELVALNVAGVWYASRRASLLLWRWITYSQMTRC